MRAPPWFAEPPSPPTARPRFLSEADCHAVAQRLARYAKGGGYTGTLIVSSWAGNVRWARNQISTSGEVRNNHIMVDRDINGAQNCNVFINESSDEALVAAARRAERLTKFDSESRESDMLTYWNQEPYTAPQLFVDTTYQQDAGHRAAAARALAQSAADAGMLSAGYIEVSANSMAFLGSWGYARYFQYTWARYSVTVRDPKGTGSGWAGVDWPDWSKIDGPKLSAIALDKCLKSRNPVAVEPGRYTTILEPQAVCDFVGQMMEGDEFDAVGNNTSGRAPFNKTVRYPGFSRLGERVIDERITISADPLDPELGFPPYSIARHTQGVPMSYIDQDVYHPATWIENGVLKTLSANRYYNEIFKGSNTGMPESGAFRMSGGETSIDEMIATTKRGLLVTRFDQVQKLDDTSILCRGYTRDGLWLIENGKISKPVKNMVFTESVLFALNNVEQLGVPQRAFHPTPDEYRAWIWWMMLPAPRIVPPLKVKDFSFTALADAI